MSRPPAKLYADYPGNLRPVIERTLVSALSIRRTEEPIPVFFRADDIGVPSLNFTLLIELFRAHRMPLGLAVVPAWLTQTRWTAIDSICRPDTDLWCWHQHGFSHKNHEPSGKKYEFGPHRAVDRIHHDIVAGRNRLRDIMGASFSPYFTPPWNRCSQATLAELETLGFKAISRSRDSAPESLSLPDLSVNVDLHTRKETDSSRCLAALLLEIEKSVESGRIGIMIHHQRMNSPAFTFLDDLLGSINRSQQLQPTALSDLP